MAFSILMLFLDTGLRLSELMHLQLSKIDFPLGEMTIMGKGSKERMVPFGRPAREALVEMLSDLDDVTVAGGFDDGRVPMDGLLAWQPEFSGEFSLHMFPGGHFFVEEDRPAIVELLCALAGRVRRSEAA